MFVEKDFNSLEGVLEVRVFDVNEIDVFRRVPQVAAAESVRLSSVMKHVSSDVNVFLPCEGEDDFVVERMGWNILQRANMRLEDVVGRRFSELSPFYYGIFRDVFVEVLSSRETKALRIFYLVDGVVRTLSDIHVICDEGELYVTSDYKNIVDDDVDESFKDKEEANKASLIEYFSQTGSYFKSRGEFTWTPGVYNIINRSKEPGDKYYNIIFDLVVPEDRPLVEELLQTMSPETDSYENIIRIRTRDGDVKYLDVYLYSKFDESGEEISHYGLFKDVSVDARHMTRPVDFMLNGFKHNTKLSLLIEPLSRRFEFSEGFYDMIGVKKEDYHHSRDIVENIVEDDVKEELYELIDGGVDEVNRIFTYKVNGSVDDCRIVELFIERFRYGNQGHSIGFLTDITLARQKQQELLVSNANKNILIKEVHHRVKNNLQVLNSFLNLERRAYGDNPDRILDNMQARLSSLALLHEKTYNTQDFTNIDLGEYLCDHDGSLASLFGAQGILFTSSVPEDVSLTIEVITPLLLIIDELTMNAVKHAFPDDSKVDKCISKEIRLLDDGLCELIFKDNGVGLDSKESLINHNLGWEIIGSLTGQIDGEISILDTSVGTAFRVVFPTSLD